MKKQLFCEDWQFCQKGKPKRTISLPHDAMQEQGRQADAPSGTGGAFFLGGTYTYEKSFWVPEAWETKDILVEFEGVYPGAEVFINDQPAGGCMYGYNLFRVPLAALNYNAYNMLRVEVDNSAQPNSRWYSGAGIYRPVWLWLGPKTHIEPDGVRVTTLSCDPAQIRVSTAVAMALENKMPDAFTGDLEIFTEIYFKGKKVAEAIGSDVILNIPDARLWDDEAPNLYQCVVTLKENGQDLDSQCENFGIRKIEYSPEGLKVNGKNVLLRGGCIHHDNGILGARSYDVSEWRRIKQLKAWGFNAIRSAHNPAGRAVLEACDALGVYVMDETWDMWNVSKNPHDYGQRFMDNYETDIASIVAKDYNHPSVIMYSIGNEVTEPATPEGMEIAADIRKRFHELDRTRPITAGINLTLLLMSAMPKDQVSTDAPDTGAMNSTAFNKMVSEMGKHMTMAAATDGADQLSSPVLDLLDIAGYNYADSRYALDRELHPGRVIVGTETYAFQLPHNWKLVEENPQVIGDFMWTAWDYLGEAGIGAWTYAPEDMGFGKKYPWLLAEAGAFDILGNDNGEAGLASVVWGKRKTPYIGVRPVNHPGIEPGQAIWRGTNALPSWSFTNCDGNPAMIEVYSPGSEIELMVNGRTIGRKPLEYFKADFLTAYEPGEIKALAYDGNGHLLSESVLISAEGQTCIHIAPETETVKYGDVFYVDISLTGENGIVECNRDTKLKVTVEGGELLAFGSARPKTEESFLEGAYTTYYGRSQAIIKAAGEQVTIRVSGDGLKSSSERVTVSGAV